MKNLRYLFIALIAIVITSCQFTEEITINKNGSGNYKLNVDMGGMMDAMNGMEKNDTIQKEYEKIDSIFYMKELLEANKDSISKLSDSERKTIEALKDMKMHIKMDEEKGEMLIDFILDFKNISELDNIKQKVEKAQQLQDNKGKEDASVENHEVMYSYNKRVFERKVIMKDLTAEEQESFDKNMAQGSMFLSGSKYKLIYHFPKKIKKVNYSDAQFSDDHKTLIIEVEMDSIIANPKLLDLEVIF